MPRPEPVDRLLDALPSATDRLLTTVRRLSDDEVRRASALPGWSVGHVLAHLARNAEGMTNLCTWARTGVPTPAYGSAEIRNRDIETGAARPAAAQAEDIRDTADRLFAALTALPDDAWERRVSWPSGTLRPAWNILPARLNEVETHHVDLGLGQTFAEVPAGLRDVLLEYAMSNLPPDPGFRLRADDTGWSWGEPGARIVSGDSAELLGWVLGRTGGTALSHDGALPSLPAWG